MSSVSENYNLEGQNPLDAKTISPNKEVFILKIKSNEFYFFTFYSNMKIFFQKENEEWIWIENNDEIKDIPKLLEEDYVYPENTIAYGFDYSNKAFNFIKYENYLNIKINNFKIDDTLQGDGFNIKLGISENIKSDILKGVEAYSWGDHSVQDYVKRSVLNNYHTIKEYQDWVKAYNFKKFNVLNDDSSLLIDKNESNESFVFNVDSNVSFFQETKKISFQSFDYIYDLKFKPTQIIGVYINGIKNYNYKINIPKSIKIKKEDLFKEENESDLAFIEIQYLHLKTN